MVERLDDYYLDKRPRDEELVDLWAICFGAFWALVVIVVATVWMAKLTIWLFARMLGL